MIYAPVVLFVYKRKDKVKQCLESLEKNILCSETDLFIYSDGYKGDKDREDVEEVKAFIKEYSYMSKFRSVSIVSQEKNRGLAESILNGVTEVIEKYEKIIVVEDDLIVSLDFLEYMNRALEFYKDNTKVGAISAYTYPLKTLSVYNKDIYFMRKGECWGWGTWKNCWNNAVWANLDYKVYYRNWKERSEFESLEAGFDSMMYYQMKGKIDSWAVRWVYNLFKENLYTVYPKISRVNNNGFDGDGTHSTKNADYSTSFSLGDRLAVFEDMECNKELEKEAFNYTQRIGFKYKIYRIFVFIKYVFNII